MKLREVEFGSVFGASGVEGFFGEGYPYHKYLKLFGLSFNGMTFVAKTTTLNPKIGNMMLRVDGITPYEMFPKCIVVKPLKGVALNSVGLSGPGAKKLFEDGRWQKRTRPFFLSFMSVAQTPHERASELSQFVRMFMKYLPQFRTRVGLQINFSCPNVGLHPEDLINEVSYGLDIAGALDIPLMPKLNVLVPPGVACQIAKHPYCDALCVSNTIPWGKLPESIDWKGLFGSNRSPLEILGGGGLSGKPLLPLVEDWVRRARALGLRKPINAGGGILSLSDVLRLLRVGADSVFIGSMAFLRFWRVQRTISYMNRLNGP